MLAGFDEAQRLGVLTLEPQICWFSATDREVRRP